MKQRRADSPRAAAAELRFPPEPAARETVQRQGANQGSTDYADELIKMGLSRRTAWYACAVLYGCGGLLVITLCTAAPGLLSHRLIYLGCVALLLAGLALLVGPSKLGAKLSFEATTHFFLLTSLAIYVVGDIILEDQFVAFALLPLLTIPVPCYLYPLRLAIPYTLVTASIVFVGLLLVPGPARVAHAHVTTCATLLIAAAIIVTKQRTRGIASRNRRLAYTDPLTGLANVRQLRRRISARIGRHGGEGSPFALFTIDLDNFKEVNDRFDHSLGDRVLCAVADALRHELEADDTAVRRGGDEFSVLVPNPSVRDLDELRGRLESAIVGARLATCPQVTPSGSVAYIRTRPGEELGAMMERADQKLHEVKLSSRDRGRRDQTEPAARADLRSEQGIRAADDAEQLGSPAPSADSQLTGSRKRIWRAAITPLVRCDPDWGFAALLLVLGAMEVSFLALTGLIRPLAALVGLAMGSAILGLICVAAGNLRISQKWLHLPWLAAYGLLFFELTVTGRSGTALLDLVPAIAIYGFLVFNAASAALYMVLGGVLYGTFAIGGDFAQGVARTVITVVVVAAVGGLVAKLRRDTVRVARINRELSELDPLTGVANLRALRARIVDVVRRASGLGRQPALVAIDLDEFKQVNDSYSHSTGDAVLVAVARAISEHVRIDELVARRGGDEFFVVIEDAEADYADAVVDRLEQAIARTRKRMCPDLRTSASVTWAPWRPGETPEDLLRDADVALHAKKAQSRLAPQLVASAAGLS